MLALTQPRAEAVLAARLEERGVAPPFKLAHRLVDLCGSQCLDVLFKSVHQLSL